MNKNKQVSPALLFSACSKPFPIIFPKYAASHWYRDKYSYLSKTLLASAKLACFLLAFFGNTMLQQNHDRLSSHDLHSAELSQVLDALSSGWWSLAKICPSLPSNSQQETGYRCNVDWCSLTAGSLFSPTTTHDQEPGKVRHSHITMDRCGAESYHDSTRASSKTCPKLEASQDCYKECSILLSILILRALILGHLWAQFGADQSLLPV